MDCPEGTGSGEGRKPLRGAADNHPSAVIAGLAPAIHLAISGRKRMAPRVKPAGDGSEWINPLLIKWINPSP
jgi:hypothetical protein